jgi:hypothetical protein
MFRSVSILSVVFYNHTYKFTMDHSNTSTECNSNSLTGMPSLYQTMRSTNNPPRRRLPLRLDDSFLSRGSAVATSPQGVLEIINRALQIVDLADLSQTLDDDSSDRCSLYRPRGRDTMNSNRRGTPRSPPTN